MLPQIDVADTVTVVVVVATIVAVVLRAYWWAIMQVLVYYDQKAIWYELLSAILHPFLAGFIFIGCIHINENINNMNSYRILND